MGKDGLSWRQRRAAEKEAERVNGAFAAKVDFIERMVTAGDHSHAATANRRAQRLVEQEHPSTIKGALRVLRKRDKVAAIKAGSLLHLAKALRQRRS